MAMLNYQRVSSWDFSKLNHQTLGHIRHRDSACVRFSMIAHGFIQTRFNLYAYQFLQLLTALLLSAMVVWVVAQD